MIIAVLNEGPQEQRVAMTPHAVKQYTQLGLTIRIEQGAGDLAGFANQAYQDVGATLVNDRKALLSECDVLLSVNTPTPKEIKPLTANSLLIAPVDNDPNHELITYCIKQKISLFSMNLVPRISRAQGMDSLSSQANLAGYRAVIEAVYHYHRAIPMMMTAAGMIHPAKILILGAGVAGLQAIATAKRLGAVVYAFDVRTAAKEQVESLGAEFIAVADNTEGEGTGGYAKEMSASYKEKQAALLADYIKKVDIVITTALIPGKPAPLLITEAMVASMKKGSVIVDIATARGGNCALSQDHQLVQYEGKIVIGHSQLAGFVPATASELYCNNLLQVLKMLVVEDALQFKAEDDIVKQALLCHQGLFLPYQLQKEVDYATS